MTDTLYKIKDSCRKELIKYTFQALSHLPKIEQPTILDMGCGTGLSSLALIKTYNATVYAVDSDSSCISYLNRQVEALGYADRIHVLNASALDPMLFNVKVDIVLAEGLLNAVGFDRGIPLLLSYLKPDGYLVIHEALFNNTQKDIVFQKHNLKLVHFFQLDEVVWKTEYFDCLENEINQQTVAVRAEFENECDEISWFKKNPVGSAYYILQTK